jgi:hypothetical protein
MCPSPIAVPLAGRRCRSSSALLDARFRFSRGREPSRSGHAGLQMHRPMPLSLRCSKPALASRQRRVCACSVGTPRRSRARRFPTPREPGHYGRRQLAAETVARGLPGTASSTAPLGQLPSGRRSASFHSVFRRPPVPPGRRSATGPTRPPLGHRSHPPPLGHRSTRPPAIGPLGRRSATPFRARVAPEYGVPALRSKREEGCRSTRFRRSFCVRRVLRTLSRRPATGLDPAAVRQITGLGSRSETPLESPTEPAATWRPHHFRDSGARRRRAGSRPTA